MFDLRQRLVDEFRWRTDSPHQPWAETLYADYSKWWRDESVLSQIGSALADLFEGSSASVILGTESHGFLLGPLVAQHLGIGFAGVQKGFHRVSDNDQWLTRHTPPDYNDRHVELAIRRSLLTGTDRVLFVDEWAATGSQAFACQQLVDDANATWLGAAVIVDALQSSATRRQLHLRALLHERDLPRR